MKKSALMIVFATLFGVVGASYGGDAAKAKAKDVHQLKDGGTLYIFQDGKMAKEDRYGKAVYLKKGESLETVEGKKIVANSNEVARLGNLLTEGHEN